jgi:glycerol-3-phosphate O-acyltransferase
MPRFPSLAELTGVGRTRLPLEPAPPEVAVGMAVVFLLDSSTGLEDRLLQAWVERAGAAATEVVSLAPSRIRRPTRRTDPRLDAILHRGEDVWLVPLRVVWMPAERRGRRTVSWVDVLQMGDPRDPRWLRDHLILALHPDRVRIVVGEGAAASQLRADHADSVEWGALRDFVTRRAWRALDRAERAVRGDRYKIPRFVREDIVGRPRFRDEVVRLGRERGLPEPVAMARARYYLREMAASHSPYVIDLIASFIHWAYSQGYGAIRYDPGRVGEIAQLGRDHPLVFLPSHRSNLDRLVLQFTLWENDLPPNHTAGGINMNFFPIGPLIRRTGVFFIRRSFKDNELYKFVVKTYIDYLIEKRLPLEWYMEGGRSRTGKLRPPRFGMLSWVVDSYRRGMADDIYLLPISIAYDHIQDVDAYAAEASGQEKEKESFAWALKVIRSLRRRHGDIHIDFGEPISVAKELQGTEPSGDVPIEVRKLAFEVMYRISSVTPVTPTAVVAIALLEAKGAARDAGSLAASCGMLVDLIERSGIPTTTDLDLRTPTAVERVLGAMAEHRLVSSQRLDDRTVYWTSGDATLRASYYRNMVVHFFVPRALAELALDAADLGAFWTDLLDLRDLLKFEFFFADKDDFAALVGAQLEAEAPGWEERVLRGEGASVEMSPRTASWAVLPLLEAYLVVADELAATPGPVVDHDLVEASLERGRLYRREGRITSDESVSANLFEGAVRLVANRGLTAPGAGSEEREAFARSVRRYVERAQR